MKITGVETVLYEYELSRPIGDVNIPDGMRRRADLAVFLRTDEGIDGVATASRLGLAAIPALSTAIIGEDPLRHRGLWERMIRGLVQARQRGSDGHRHRRHRQRPVGPPRQDRRRPRSGSSSGRWSPESWPTPADWTAP